eukprot:5816001-Pleurochrysis_carterae.AAC.1
MPRAGASVGVSARASVGVSAGASVGVSATTSSCMTRVSASPGVNARWRLGEKPEAVSVPKSTRGLAFIRMSVTSIKSREVIYLV